MPVMNSSSEVLRRSISSVNVSYNTRNNKFDNKINQSIVHDFLNVVPEIKDHFDVIDRIGAGTFSTVYLAKLKKNTKQEYALKHLLPTSHPDRIENELRCLLETGGHGNVIPVEACIRHLDSVVIVMPYVAHDHFQDYFHHLSVEEIQLYMRNLLIALQNVHSKSIIHRDVKPSNFLYRRCTKQFCLVDFGLAQRLEEMQRYQSHSSVCKRKSTSQSSKSCVCFGRGMVCSVCLKRPSQHAPRAGTPGFRAPEVLLKHPKQNTAVDIWSSGVIMLSLLSGVYPFFKAQDDLTALAQINYLFGTDALTKAAASIGKRVLVQPTLQSQPLENVCKRLRKRQSTNVNYDVPSCAYDLLDKLLTLDPSKRITAEDALKHQFLNNGISKQSTGFSK